MDELVRSDVEAPDGTGYNDPPFNLKEITEKEFAQSQFHSYSFTHVEFRQMLLKEDLSPGKLGGGKLMSGKLFWFGDDTGVAIVPEHWKGKIRYFSFGCNHKLDSKTYEPGKTYHCSKCNTDVKAPWMDLISEDSGWKMNEHTSRPGRGIRDYDRVLKFSAPLSHSHLLMVVKFLKKVDCPGWTGVTVKDQGGATYKFSTTYDSSD
jgi:hypothetical protein